MPEQNETAVAWLRARFRNDRHRLRNAWLLALVTALAGMALLGLSGWFISAAALAGLAAAGPAVAFNLLAPSSGIRALAMGRTVARYFERLLSHDATFQIMQRLRTQLFSAILPRIPGPLSHLSGGHLLERLLGDVERLENAWLGQWQPGLVAAATAVLLLALAWLFAGPLAALPMLILFALITALLLTLSRRAAAPLQARMATRDQMRSQLVQTLQGLPDVLAYGLRPRLLRDWQARLGALATLEHRLALQHAVAQALTQSLMQWLAVGVLLVLLAPVQQGDVSAPLALALMLLVLAAAEVTLPLAQAFQRWPDTRHTVARLRTLTDTPLPRQAATGSGQPEPDGTLHVDMLCFTWPGAPALFDALTFQAQAGTPLAIIGPSGSGKSTLLHCLMGLQRADAGSIRFGGATQQEAAPDAWRACFALLLQQQQLFTGTLRDNLRLAHPDADDALLWHTLEQARLADVVHRRGGLDLWIGPQGLHLSGGQGRRLSLARVLLRDSPVILLDEPFTGLEAKTADSLFDTLQHTLRERILIMATHDPRHAERLPERLILGTADPVAY